MPSVIGSSGLAVPKGSCNQPGSADAGAQYCGHIEMTENDVLEWLDENTGYTAFGRPTQSNLIHFAKTRRNALLKDLDEVYWILTFDRQSGLFKLERI